MKLFILLLFIIPACLFAGIDPNNQADSLLTPFVTSSATWRTSLLPAAKSLFWSLVVIDWVIEFGFMGIKGTDFPEILAVLIRKILIIGFFLMLFQYNTWLSSIPSSMIQLGNTVSGVSVSPDNILNNGILIVTTIWKSMSIMNIGDSIVLALCGVIMLIAFALMAAQLFMTYVKTYALLALAPLVFSLGGLGHTRQMAFNPFFAIIKSGLELLLLELYMGLTITRLTQFAANVDNDTSSILSMVVTAILMVSVVQMVPGMVESLMSGTLGANSTSGLGTAKAMMAGATGAVAGAAVGAVGMGAAVKAASNLAKEQKAGGDSSASTFKNLRSAFGSDIKRSFAGENYGGSTGGRMAFKHSNAESLDSKAQAQKAVNSGANTQNNSNGSNNSSSDLNKRVDDGAFANANKK